ncbi:MAG: hypothetical protein L6R42_003436 [Xanthoria sp. 1 TBL-2021]|nr:MAG: hypothetical protein L6R42_003436 [Xanthoria sp. 1 TBL-2021]
MIAQSTPKPAAGDEKKPSSAKQKEQLVAMLGEYLTSLSINTDQDQLTTRFEPVDLASRDIIPAIIAAISTYMKEDAKVPDEQSAAILQQGQQVMGAVLPELGIEIPVDEEDLPPAPKVKETVFIEDVFAYKTGLAMSKGPVPVRALSEFEDKDVVVVDGNGRSESKL